MKRITLILHINEFYERLHALHMRAWLPAQVNGPDVDDDLEIVVRHLNDCIGSLEDALQNQA